MMTDEIRERLARQAAKKMALSSMLEDLRGDGQFEAVEAAADVLHAYFCQPGHVCYGAPRSCGEEERWQLMAAAAVYGAAAKMRENAHARVTAAAGPEMYENYRQALADENYGEADRWVVALNKVTGWWEPGDGDAF
jgi:hypothetical protein